MLARQRCRRCGWSSTDERTCFRTSSYNFSFSIDIKMVKRGYAVVLDPGTAFGESYIAKAVLLSGSLLR